uniref:Uncharacterized protein n=1 Tax=Dicentrarchus labrax TaxID=13489 RepID=A0A8C4I3L3_DICLA
FFIYKVFLPTGLQRLEYVSYSRAVNAVAPVMCCFNFFRGRIPQRQIISIIKTDSRCVEKGFVYVLYSYSHFMIHSDWTASTLTFPKEVNILKSMALRCRRIRRIPSR